MKKLLLLFFILLPSLVFAQELGQWRWTHSNWSTDPNAVYSHIMSHLVLSQLVYDIASDNKQATEWQKIRIVLIYHFIFSVGKETWDGLVPNEFFNRNNMNDLAFLGGDGFDYAGDITANITGLGLWFTWNYRSEIKRFIKHLYL